MQRIIPEEAPLWTQIAVQVEIGDVVEEVLNVAAEINADLIVLGVNSDVSFWPIHGDDTVYSIIAQAKSPVLSIRHRAEIRM
jgi:nucleotide-binding universal stress UspA family protein